MTDEVISGDKNPVVALILNLCLFGCVGYFYIGQWQKGLVALAALLILGVIGIGLVVPIFTCIDGYMQAKVMQDGGSVGHWTFFNNTA